MKTKCSEKKSVLIFILFLITGIYLGSDVFSQTLNKDSNLTFPGVISNSNTVIIVTPSMNGFAAEFELITDPAKAVTVTVEGGGIKSCNISTGGSWLLDLMYRAFCQMSGSGIIFSDFTYGGDLNPDGTGVTDSVLGKLNIRIGGRAQIPGGALTGTYEQNLTLRVKGSGIDESIAFTARILSTRDLAITVAKGLEFPMAEQLDYPQNIVVTPTDPGAAIFHVVGDPYDSVTASVPSTVNITNGTHVITLDTFLFGGGFNPLGNGTLDNEGNIRGYIGATANIPANPASGVYTGTITLTVIRN